MHFVHKHVIVIVVMRSFEITPHVNAHTTGSCLVKAGMTHVLCTASFTEKRPHFLSNTSSGWISAEYSMLPHATHTRTSRESGHKPKGRTMEIQRLIARVLRSACSLEKLNGFHILIDCDVLQADGSTRTNSINGAFVALSLTIKSMLNSGLIDVNPLKHEICAISCALQGETFSFDPTYEQDFRADADCNLIFTHQGKLVEIQATGEKGPLNVPSFDAFFHTAFHKTSAIRQAQQKALAQGQ